jgi:hypothetical protein
MEYIKFFIIIQVIFILLQSFNTTKLEPFQYCELIFGSFFILIFFGIFALSLTSGYINLNLNSKIIENASIIGCLFPIWFYITKKSSNLINSDSNGVIYY